MAEKLVRIGNSGPLITKFVYEGETLALEDDHGHTMPIKPEFVYMALREATLEDGEPCHYLIDRSPLTKLDIVVLEDKKEVTSA